MMTKFLLLFCFTTLYVLGEEHGNIAAIKNDSVSAAASIKKDNAEPIAEEYSTLIPSAQNDKKPSIITPAPASSIDTNASKQSTPEPTPSSIQTTTPSITSLPTTTPSTTTPSTTTPSTTTSTTSSTTSTTLKTTTTTTPASTTTSAPSTTSIPTTVAPTPQNPKKWIVREGNTTCIVVQMSVQFNITYPAVNKTFPYIIFDIPVDNETTTVSGNCGKLEQVLSLVWFSKNTSIGNMSLHFKKNETTTSFSLHHLEVVFPATDFPNTILNQSMVLMHESTNYTAGLTNSYRCLKKQSLNLMNNGTNSGTITITGLQFEAFKTDNSSIFGLAKDCAFETTDVVPIAVGCALAGLVIIVLVAYLIGHRFHPHGYQRM